MTKTDEYRAILPDLDQWDAYLLKESGLPGPRGNLELAQAVADEGDLQRFQRYITCTAAEAYKPYKTYTLCTLQKAYPLKVNQDFGRDR